MAVGVGVIGAGVVGGGVIETLQRNRDAILGKSGVDLRLAHVAERNLDAVAEFDLEGVRVSQDAAELLADPDVEIVCELIGGVEPAKSFILEAMQAGKSVVTANKMLLAMAGPELTEAALRHGVELRFEAAVAGAIPIIKAIREGLVANRVSSVYGIVNGTCNYILSRMTYDGLEFDPVLQEAMDLGFAERPPDLDIHGYDSAHKCQILASICFSTPINLEDVYVEGIAKVTQMDVRFAQEMGYVVKLLAVTRRIEDEIEVRVHPTLVPETMLLAAVRNEFNAVYVETDVADATMYYGRGAGRLPTASAVVGNIVDIARRGDDPAPPPFRYTSSAPIRDIGKLRGRYYMRLAVHEHSGVLGSIFTVLGDHDVSIATCIQNEQREDDGPTDIVLMTYGTVESRVMAALATIDAMDFIAEPTHVIRVLS